MANLKEIRGRITSVKNTRKITSAMSRIASARLARSQAALTRARRYGSRMEEVVGELVAGLDEHVEHPLLTPRPGNRVALVVVSADRGLCGGFNTQIGKAARKFVEARREKGDELYLIAVGRKAFDYLRSLGINHDRMVAAPDPKTVVEQANELATELLASFEGEHTEGEEDAPFDEIHLLYNHFINVLTQEPTTKQLLPVPPVKADESEQSEGMSLERTFEPDVDTLLNHLLPVSVRTAVQQAFFHSAAAELAARRTAMDAATDNASNLISDLTLEYNRERQAAITTELAEIVGGAEALKG